jgi:hypothetical protein
LTSPFQQEQRARDELDVNRELKGLFRLVDDD